MDYNQQLDLIFQEMISYFEGDAKRTQHFVKVHSLAKLIAHKEGLSDKQCFILEAAAYVHDIGIKPAEQIYGSSNGKNQELLGPKQAEIILEKCGFSKYAIDRICYLVAHHHTYESIDFIDYQILVEADFLVNLYEDNASKTAIENAYAKIFKTETGKSLCKTIYKI